MRRFLLQLVLVFALGLLGMLGRGVEVEQFTYDGKTRAKSSTNDPTSIQAKEWQIWLYSANFVPTHVA
jgi:hypothetical protein